MNIGIYGGAFDPPHIGHANAACQAVSLLSLDLLYVVPALSPPLKASPAAPPGRRLEMCRLAFRGENIVVDDFEIKKGGVSYTKDTLRHYGEMHPGARFFLIIGNDQLNQIEKWNSPEYIFKNAAIALVMREKNADPESDIKRAQSMGANIIRVDIAVTEVSSTEIRNGQNTNRLDPVISEYIKTNGLYKKVEYR